DPIAGERPPAEPPDLADDRVGIERRRGGAQVDAAGRAGELLEVLLVQLADHDLAVAVALEAVGPAFGQAQRAALRRTDADRAEDRAGLAQLRELAVEVAAVVFAVGQEDDRPVAFPSFGEERERSLE